MYNLKNLLFFSASSTMLIAGNAFAKSHFLPNYEDHLASYRSTDLNFSKDKTDNCAGFNLTKCPKYGICSNCSFGKLLRLNRCKDGYQISGNACVAKQCNLINSAYLSNVPDGKNCNIVNTNGIICYQSCRAVSCSTYTLTACPSNAYCSTCPDCEASDTQKGLCSTPLLKINGCKNSSQKISIEGTTCVDKDDTCPSSYYKTCETGVEPSATIEYTELGTPCYQCKARTCNDGRFNIDNYWCDSALRCLLK